MIDWRNSRRETTVIRGVRLVDNGKVITSAGVQAGMDMALHVVARLLRRRRSPARRRSTSSTTGSQQPSSVTLKLAIVHQTACIFLPLPLH